MTEQYKVITTGELNASIEGFGEFTTKEVEFIGSDAVSYTHLTLPTKA